MARWFAPFLTTHFLPETPALQVIQFEAILVPK
jgi:hypothetical protein